MKKLLLLILVAAGVGRLHAQTLKSTNPQVLIFPKSSQNFNFNDTSLFKPFSLAKSNELLALNGFKANNTEIFYSRMPVAKPFGYNKMPVAKPGDTNMSYPILDKKIKVADPLLKWQPMNAH